MSAHGTHRAVLFDLFDTLCRIDEPIYMAGRREQACLLGVEADRFLSAWMQVSDAAQAGTLADLRARLAAACHILGISPPEDRVAEVLRLEAACLVEATSLWPDALPTLQALGRRPGLGLGLVSNASSSGAMLFESLGLAPCFHVAVFSFREGMVKPDPRIYQRACDRLGVPASACLFVGDGNCMELDGAKAVGMEAVRIERPVVPGHYRRGESLSFDASISDLREVLDLVRT